MMAGIIYPLNILKIVSCFLAFFAIYNIQSIRGLHQLASSILWKMGRAKSRLRHEEYIDLPLRVCYADIDPCYD